MIKNFIFFLISVKDLSIIYEDIDIPIFQITGTEDSAPLSSTFNF